MIVACVLTGTKYSVKYVTRLRAMVDHHLARPHEFLCFTDRKKEVEAAGITAVDIAQMKLPIWWGKMALFAHSWRQNHRVLYFDLDTVIVGDLSPLAALPIEFGICANFTRASGNLEWPCNFGSCVMTMSPSFDGELFARFWPDRHRIMLERQRYGDQKVIEDFMPDAMTLQPLLPENYFLHYKKLPEHSETPPVNCSMVIFGGKNKPHNTTIGWVKEAWERFQ